MTRKEPEPELRGAGWAVRVMRAVVWLMFAASVIVGVAALIGGVDAFWPLAAEVDLGTTVLGLALLLVALAFQFGEPLLRDADGLI